MKEKLGTDEADYRYMYNAWDMFEDMMDEESQFINLQSLKRKFSTLTYPKNEQELFINVAALTFLSRPVELILGSKILIYNFLICQALTMITNIPKFANKLDVPENKNLNSLCLSASLFFLWNDFTKVNSFLKFAVFGSVIYCIFWKPEYDYRAGLLTGIIMPVIIRTKFNI